MKDPLASDNLLSLRLRYNVVHLQVLLGSHLIIAGCEPFGSIQAGHGFIIGLQLRDISISNIGMMTVGRDVVMQVVIRDGRMDGVLGTRDRG